MACFVSALFNLKNFVIADTLVKALFSEKVFRKLLMGDVQIWKTFAGSTFINQQKGNTS